MQKNKGLWLAIHGQKAGLKTAAKKRAVKYQQKRIKRPKMGSIYGSQFVLPLSDDERYW